MTEKLLVLITGANQGLGYEVVQQLSLQNRYHVLLGSRDYSKAQSAIEAITDMNTTDTASTSVEPIQIDVTSDESISAAAQTVEAKFGHLDILMVNAGISRAPGSTRAHYQQVYDTNLFGAAVTVDTFLPLLRKSTNPGGKRIAFTSSDLSSMQIALTSGDVYCGKNLPVYRSSKSALNMLMISYARLLEEEGFVVSASNPGFCSTNLNNNKGPKDPKEGAKELIKAIELSAEQAHGHVVDENGWLAW